MNFDEYYNYGKKRTRTNTGRISMLKRRSRISLDGGGPRFLVEEGESRRRDPLQKEESMRHLEVSKTEFPNNV